MPELPIRLQEITTEGRTDPVVFINELLGMPLHQGQVRYLRETCERGSKINLLICANRWGKTALVSCLQIWFLFYKRKFGDRVWASDDESWLKAEYRTTNIAPHSALTEPVFRAIHAILTSAYPVPDGKGGMTTNQCHIEWFYERDRTINTAPYKQYFYNNSYIEHRSLAGNDANPIEGKPYGLITYDEGGRSHHLQDEMDSTILARLFDWGAPFHMPSTPDKDSASVLYHFKLWQDGQLGINETYAQEGPLKENHFFSEEQIEAEYMLYANNPLRDQRLEGKFVFGGNTIFPVPDLLAISRDELNEGKRAEEGHRYIIGIDTAIGKDERVYTIIDATTKPMPVVRVDAIKGNQMSPQLHMSKLEDLADLYWGEGSLRIMLETWNEGSARFYLDLPPRLQAITNCYGAWQPETHKIKNDNPEQKTGRAIKKADLLITTAKVITAHELLIPSHEVSWSERSTTTREQLSIYKEDDKALPTDRVIALCLAVFEAERQAVQAEPEWEAVAW